ncbi:MAG TPA: ATP-binding protein [Chloroflexota bacterium]
MVVVSPLLRLPESALRASGTMALARRQSLAALRAERNSLAADNVRLEELVRAQGALITASAHDLKNALASITLRADLLQDVLDDAGPESTESGTLSLRTGLTRIQATSSNMARHLDELLGLARKQAGHRLDLVREPMDLVALVRRVVAEYTEQPGLDGIQVTTTEAELIGEWDVWRLERMLRNLLGNAVKFSPHGGAISLRLRREHVADATWAVLAVGDQGLGIPDADLDAVFERFYRGANVRGLIAGSGIGLAGAQQIVQEHGGSLTVESREAVGSTFTVRLPLALTLERPDLTSDVLHAPAADTAAVLSVLSTISLLATIPKAVLQRLAEQCSIRTFAVGACLVQQGDLSESFFLVVKGRVRVERSRGRPTEPVILAELEDGTVIGEMGALDQEPRSATVIAVEATMAVEIPAPVLVDVLLRYREVAAGLLRGVSRRLRLADERIDQVNLGEPIATTPAT